MRRTNLVLIPLVLFIVGACSSRTPIINSMEADELFLHGAELLQQEEWSDAIAAYERFLIVYPSHERAAEARFGLAQGYMGRGEYITSAIEFNRLVTEQPSGPLADDARYHVCLSYERLSPEPPLDQEYTRTAISHCQALIEYHPDSEFAGRASEIVERMTNRLAEKEYGTAEHYFRRNAFDSAIIYYLSVADQYPATPWAPRALLRLIESYRERGYTPEAEAARDRLVRDYPDSPEAAQVRGVGDDGTL